MTTDEQRTIGLGGATSVGVGAIVGGGIMVLAGAAFSATGPSAIVAFALNGVIAFLTAMSFAEVSTSFPQSGGAYTFAKKVLSVRAAFAVGWVMWFAYAVAAVLYAYGFAAFARLLLTELLESLVLRRVDWLSGRRVELLLAVAATLTYTLMLVRRSSGGGRLATIGKTIAFIVIVGAGLLALARTPAAETGAALSPFFSGGGAGLFLAMGFTFIALQGFDLIPAIASEVKDPERNIPRAMFLSLGIALVLYLPLLFVVSTVGVGSGGSISEMASAEGDTVFATAVSRFMGPWGYWLVVVAAILSTLSALHANLLAASRVCLSMAQDRMLPVVLQGRSKAGTPMMAVLASALTVATILFMVPDVAAAGAAASLIFLVSFALVHVTAYLARSRTGAGGYRTPWFPLIPAVGGVTCAALAIFQAVVVPEAGGVALVWLGLGGFLYVSLFRSGAEVADAQAEALDPQLVRLRGRTPLVLVPVANPASAGSLVTVANALAPTEFARVLVLTVVARPDDRESIAPRLEMAQEVLRQALSRSYAEGHAPEALITSAREPWEEIRRVALEHRCESMLLGLGPAKADQEQEATVERLLNQIDCDIAVMRAQPDWELDGAKRVLVPLGGRGRENELRARVLGSLCRARDLEVTFVTVLPASVDDAVVADTERGLSELAEVKVPGQPRIVVLRDDDPIARLLAEAEDYDLMVVGLKSAGWGRRVLGEVSLRIAREARCPTLMLSGAPSRAYSDLYRPLRSAVTKRSSPSAHRRRSRASPKDAE